MKVNEESTTLLNRPEKADLEEGEIINWAKHSFLSKTKSTVKNTVANIGGYLFAGAGSIVSFTLGRYFGETVAEKIDDDSIGLDLVLGYLFGISAFVSLLSLGGLAASDRFNAWINPKELLNKQETKIIQRYISLFLSTMSALQYGYITGKYMESDLPVSLSFAILGFIMYTWFNDDAIDAVMDEVRVFYIDYKDIQYKKDKHAVFSKIKNIKQCYLAADLDIIQNKYDLIFNNTNALVAMQELFSTIDFDNTFTNKTNKHPLARDILSGLTFSIGSLVGYAYYVVSLELAEWFFQYVKYNNESAKPVSILFSIIASLGNGALGAVKLRKRFLQIYDKMMDSSYRFIPYSTNRKIRIAFLYFSVVCGIAAATPITYLIYDYIANQRHGYPGMLVMLIPTFFAPIAIRSESFERMLNRFMNYYRSYQEPTVDDQRDKIITSLDDFSKVVPKLSKNTFYNACRLFSLQSHEKLEAGLPVINPVNS